MKYRLNDRIELINRERREMRNHLRLRSLAGLAAAFLAVYSLILPSFTMEKPSFCGYEEHTHSDECFEYVLDCPVTGETGTVISANEFRALPGASEIEAKEKAAKESADGIREEVDRTSDDKEDGIVVSKAEKTEKKEKNHKKTATASDYEEDGVDLWFMYENAGSAYPESEEEEIVSYAVVNSDGAAGTVSDMADEITPDAEEEEYSEEAELLQDDEETFEAVSAAEDEELYEDVYEDAVEDLVIAEAEEESASDEDSAAEEIAEEEEAASEDPADEYTRPAETEAADDTIIEEQEGTAAASFESGHVHTAACYKKVTVCGMEEHAHGLECFIDPEADVEDEAMLEDLFPTFEEVKAEDSYEYAAELAEFQKGYRESVRNYMIITDEDGEETIQGYTRYGDWAGDAYAVDWSPLFAAFTADHAGLDIDGYDPEMMMDAGSWMLELRERALEDETAGSGSSRLFREVEDYIGIDYAEYLEEDEDDETLNASYYREGLPAAPARGELVFLDLDGDFDADHVGIIIAVSLGKNRMTVITGDVNDRVREDKYGFDDMQVLGYARLPETEEAAERNASFGYAQDDADLAADETDDAEDEMRRRFELARDYPAQDFDDQTETMQVQVSAGIGTFPAGTTMVLTDIYDEDTLNVIAGAIEEGRKVKSVQAVDISFYNEYGEEIEPLLPVQVRMTSLQEEKPAADQLSVVHLDDQGSTEIMKEEAISPEITFEASIEIQGSETEMSETNI